MRRAPKSPGEKVVKDIKRATRKYFSSEEKIRTVSDGLRGEDSIAEPFQLEGISKGVFYERPENTIQAFNGRFRVECLNVLGFTGFEDRVEKLEAWRRVHSEERPHSALGAKVPAALMKSPGASSPSM